MFEQQPIKCRCCHTVAPMKLTKIGNYFTGNVRQPAQFNTPDLTGWMVIDYPFKDPRHSNAPEGVNPGSQFKEKIKLCPKCASYIMGTLVHVETNGAR